MAEEGEQVELKEKATTNQIADYIADYVLMEMRKLRLALGVPDEAYLHVSADDVPLDLALALPATQYADEWMAADQVTRLESGPTFMRWLTGHDCRTHVTFISQLHAEDIDKLPERLQDEARKLLGLPEPAPQYTTGVVELGVQG